MGSCLCHQPMTKGSDSHGHAYFIVPCGMHGPAPRHPAVRERTEQGHRVAGTTPQQPSVALGLRAAGLEASLSVCKRRSTAEQADSGHLRGAFGSGEQPRPAIVRGRTTAAGNRFPVVFAMRATMPSGAVRHTTRPLAGAQMPGLPPATPVLTEPIIVSLTYFRRPGRASRRAQGGRRP